MPYTKMGMTTNKLLQTEEELKFAAFSLAGSVFGTLICLQYVKTASKPCSQYFTGLRWFENIGWE